MGRLLSATVSGALVLGLGLVPAGCGGGSSSTSSTNPTTTARSSNNQSASAPQSGTSGGAGKGEVHVPKVTIPLSSSAFTTAGPIPATYTCDGADKSPPLRWGALPTGTSELALFIVNLKSAPGSSSPIFYWAVAGLKPTLHRISAGTLPPGAVVGRNSLGQNGYTICPAKQDGLQHYVVALLALRHSVPATTGFDANALYNTVSNAAEYKGLTGFSYKRR